MTAYYNEPDPGKAQWLRELISAGVIAPGEVDERDIRNVKAADLVRFTQCHFFAGIGVWSYALRLAGWPDSRPVWTGSCPCPDYSPAGKGQGFDGASHLWPYWSGLIAKRQPPTIFGEQSDAAIEFGWLDLVQVDLERAAYAVGKAVLGACCIGAPHKRQRLYFVAQNNRHVCRLVHPNRQRLPVCEPKTLFTARRRKERGTAEQPGSALNQTRFTSPLKGFWRDADWLRCRDGKWRPVEPGTVPLVNGPAARILKLRSYGDAIVPQVAAAFIRAYLEIYPN